MVRSVRHTRIMAQSQKETSGPKTTQPPSKGGGKGEAQLHAQPLYTEAQVARLQSSWVNGPNIGQKTKRWGVPARTSETGPAILSSTGTPGKEPNALPLASVHEEELDAFSMTKRRLLCGCKGASSLSHVWNA